MYISGTHTIRDVLDDTLIPFHAVDRSERYAQAINMLDPGVKVVVGHSLGGAVAARMTEVYPRLIAKVYGAPLLRSTANPRVRHYRHLFDPVSMFDRSATLTKAKGWNPHSYKQGQ